MCFIFFALLAAMNVITGVFVDNAIQSAKTQREFMINKELELKETLMDEMAELFWSIDEDSSGCLTLEELNIMMLDPRVKTYFEVLGLAVTEISGLFTLLDVDKDGFVDLDEFLSGCLKLKGPARSIDLHAVMCDCKQLLFYMRRQLEHDGLDEFIGASATFSAAKVPKR